MMGCVTLVVIVGWLGVTLYVVKGLGWGMTDPRFWLMTLLGVVIASALRYLVSREDDRYGS